MNIEEPELDNEPSSVSLEEPAAAVRRMEMA
jgi:hypothetical protein